MPDQAADQARELSFGPPGRPLRVAHLTTVDMSLALLLSTELMADVDAGFATFGISAPGPYVPRIEALGVTHVPLRSLTRTWDVRRDLRATGELLKALRALRVDVLHTHNPKTGVLGRLVGRVLRVPVVVNTCHGLWTPDESGRAARTAVLAVEAVAARFSHHELYQNDSDRRALRRWVSPSRSTLVGNGVDLTRFVPDPSARQRVRRELGVADGELLVGGVGRLVAEKGIHEFAEAASALRGRATFVWAGPADPAKPDAVPGQATDVRFLGEWSDMPAYYAALDAFVLPSHREGFSRSAMEAAACGTAMVLTDIRGCREIGADEQDLLLVPPRSPAHLSRAIGRLLDDKGLRVRLAAAARRRAQQEFDQLRVAAASMDTYRSVARRRGLGWTTRERWS